MLRWFFGDSRAVTASTQLILVPDEDAQILPGFRSGPLTLTATVNETVGDVMRRFNQFRGPDAQITRLFRRGADGGGEIAFSTRILGPLECIVKKI